MHLLVNPSYISWIGKNFPAAVQVKRAVIWRLSSTAAISTRLFPCFLIVWAEVETIFIAVWSQLINNSFGIFCMTTIAFISSRNCSLISLKFDGKTFDFEFALLCKNFNSSITKHQQPNLCWERYWIICSLDPTFHISLGSPFYVIQQAFAVPSLPLFILAKSNLI